MRMARSQEKPQEVVKFVNLTMTSFTTELMSDPDAKDWIEWDVVEMTRSIGDATIPKGIGLLFSGMPALQQSFDYGQALYWVFPDLP